MITIDARIGRLLAGLGGLLLFVSLFLPWAEDPGGATRNGWELSATADVLFVTAGVLGLAAAITGGRFAFFRPDESLNGAADIVGLGAAIVVSWLILFDFPPGAGRDVGVYLALVAGVAIACGAGDFRVRSLFPELHGPSST